ncbi:MAG: hypothetical protein JKX72_01295 [Robiginitomaculum sp.]|nr:hypothetical protein [Robiginitomaculum sp.]
MGDFTPITDSDVIRAALARTVKSPEFSDSTRSVQFLQYIVEKHLSGQASEINGTTIAQDVLGAGTDFDPSTNPIVRVQAGRLRKLLAEYYRRTGKDDEVLIYIAKGQYAPQFGIRTTSIETKKAKNISSQTLAKFSIASMAILIVLISIFYGINSKLKNPPHTKVVEQIVEKYPSITILPFHNMTNNPSNDVYEQGFQHQLGTDLSRFGIVRVVFANDKPELPTPKHDTSASYILEGTILSMGGEIDLLIKLVNIKSGKIISQHRITRETQDDSYYNALANISSIISDQYVGQEGALINDSFKDIKLGLDLENHRHAN